MSEISPKNEERSGVIKEATIGKGSVSLCGVSKYFRRQPSKKDSYTTIKTGFLSWLKKRQERKSQEQHRRFAALDAVDICVAPGQALGIIGRNGSGKSTLLKLISGIYHPDEGQIDVRGRISALIELGAGFHPDFSGRENVFLGGAMYGMPRSEIERKFDQIVAFAELEDYIDDPVRTYSSGMYMRLGFSLAIFTDPDILLVDEVLAVGDAAFIHRCHDAISDLKSRGKTLIFVTHDLDSVVRWCDEAMWLSKGKIVKRGEPRPVSDAYLQDIEAKTEGDLAKRNSAGIESATSLGACSLAEGGQDKAEADSAEQAGGDNSEIDRRWGGGEMEIVSVIMRDATAKAHWVFSSEDSICVEVHYRVHKHVEDLVFGIGILRVDGLQVHGTNTSIEGLELPPELGEMTSADLVPEAGGGASKIETRRFAYVISRLGLVDGSYFLDVALHRSDGYPYDYHHKMYQFSVRNESPIQGVYTPVHKWVLEGRRPVQ